MDISIIIPTYNRYSCLRDTCEYLSLQEDCSFEILIIDQTSEDHRQYISGENIRYFSLEKPSASAARNLGILHAKSDILLFIDDDVIIEDRRFLLSHCKHYKDPSVVGVAGGAPDVGQSINLGHHRFFRSTGIGWVYFSSNYGCQTWVEAGRANNLSCRKNLAISVGGMDERFERGAHREEADFCLRLTRKYGPLLYAPWTSLVHIGNSSGGIRSWQKEEKIKAKHHMVGDLYMMLKCIPLKNWGEYIALSLFYFVFPYKLKTPPNYFIKAFFRYLSACQEAYQKIKQGPKLLSDSNVAL